ncbi:MAG: hypothetical protein AAFV32_02890 [Myxococcota bacterium]
MRSFETPFTIGGVEFLRSFFCIAARIVVAEVIADLLSWATPRPGSLVGGTSGVATQRFHYALGGALLRESGTDGVRDYIWVAGELIGVVDSAGATYHLTTDHLGSPRRAFDASSELA